MPAPVTTSRPDGRCRRPTTSQAKAWPQTVRQATKAAVVAAPRHSDPSSVR
jgi:hypothetical protein